MTLNLLSPEARVLLLALARTPDADAIATATGAPAFDWNRLMYLAEREKATAAVHGMLRAVHAAGPGASPAFAAAVHQLGRMARVSEFRMLRLEQLLADVLDILGAHAIDVVLLKGAGLATTVYGSFAARPMYDLDLLVHPQQATTAWDALRAAGWVHDEVECPPEFYASHYHLPPLDDPMKTGLAIELHMAPTDGAVDLSIDRVWKSALPVTVLGRRTLVPSPEHQVLHLATHFAWTHALHSGAWRTFQDLDRLIAKKDIDWDRVVRAADDARARTSCYWTFRLARSLASVPVPDRVLERQRPPRPEWMLDLIERHFTGALFPFGPAVCPSVRITQLLWTVGMAPRWSGHGAVRPWDRGEVWALSAGRGPALPLTARLRGHLTRGAQWGRYASALLSPAPVHDRRLHAI
ncbi:MAG: nucleotidyltransferase family protein [Gemmatimonadota bacterium]